MPSYSRLSTDDLPARERGAAWRAWMAGRFDGLDSELSGGDAGFAGHLQWACAGDVVLTSLAADAHHVVRSARGARAAAQPLLKIVVPWRGRVAVAQQGRLTWVQPGAWAVYDTSQPYAVHNPEDCHHLVVVLPKEGLFHRHETLAPLMARLVGQGRGISRVALEAMRQTFEQLPSMEAAVAQGAGETVAHLVRLSLRELAGQPTAATQQAALRDRVHDHIALHLRDPGLDVGHIAAALGCSTRQLHKVFAGRDESLARCIQRRRLEGCMHALRAPEHAGRSVTEIALSWGFNSPAHFSRLFHALVGQPPSHYRREVVRRQPADPDAAFAGVVDLRQHAGQRARAQ